MDKIISKFTKIVMIGAAFAMAGASLIGCEQKFVDYAHNGSISLTLDYKNHDFFQDGIGQVVVKEGGYIDGDTTHFLNVYGDTTTPIKIRYYGIDTPESTGAIQPYGKQASNFTKEHLEAAAENGTIVVSSPASSYQTPETDSTGSRYLGLVWINETVKDAPLSSLSLLNLYIVQEGLSWAKNLSDIPEYVDTFQDAQNQAEQFKLKLWSGEDDPLFNYGGYESVSLKDIKDEIGAFIADQDHVNAFAGMNVRFTGTVAGYANNSLYVQEYYPNDEDNPEAGGEWAGINIFTGMTPISSKYTTIGTYLSIVGTAVDSDNFGFQITNTQGHWPVSEGDDSDCQVLLTAEQNVGIHSLKTFDYTRSELNSVVNSNNLESLYCNVHVTDNLVCNDVYVNDSGDEFTLYFENSDFNVYIPFQYNGNPDDSGDIWDSEEEFIGKTFSVSGVYSYHVTTSGHIKYQIIPSSSSDLVCLTDMHGTVSSNPYTVSEAVNMASQFASSSVITYYAEGVISSIVTPYNATTQSISFIFTDNVNSITITSATLASNVDVEEMAVGTTVLVKGKLVSTNGGTFSSPEVIAAYPHGTLLGDPLSTSEASTIALALADGLYTSTTYYIVGIVTEISSAYDATSKRMTFVITTDDVSIVANGAKMGLDISYENVVVGATVIIRGKLLNDGGVAKTYSNGTQVVSICE